MNLSEFATRLIRYTYYLLFVLVPLILTPWNYELFEFNKMMITYGAAVIVLSAWVIKMIADNEVRITKTPLDIPILLFLSSQLLSSVFSIDSHVSWFGYYSRFNGGMWSLISYFILYYGFVSNFITPSAPSQNLKPQLTTTKFTHGVKIEPRTALQEILPLLYTILTTAVLVSFYGILESYGIDKNMWVQDVQHRVFSTLGQPNWLSAYLIALLPVSMWLAWNGLVKNTDGKTQPMLSMFSGGFILWTFVSYIFFWTLLLTRSRSGYLGFVLADIILAASIGIRYLPTKFVLHVFAWFGVIHFIFFLTVFVSGTRIEQIDNWVTYEGLRQKFAQVQSSTQQKSEAPTVPQETKLMDVGISQSSEIRKYVWQAALKAWKSNTKTFLLGTGTETFAFAFYEFRPKEHNMTSEWDFLYNKAHNEYLNFLATTGLFGIVTYSVLLLFFTVWFAVKIFFRFNTRQINQNSPAKLSGEAYEPVSGPSYTLSIALFAGWASILITNFFGFSVVIMQLFLILFPAFIFALLQHGTDKSSYLTLRIPLITSYRAPLTIGVSVLGAILLINLTLGWWADTVFAAGYRNNRSENYEVSEPSLSLATALRPHEPLFADELSTALSGKAISMLEAKNQVEGSELAKKAIAASDKAVTISPHNVNFWKTRTKLFYSLSTYDTQLLPLAISSLETAHGLSPNDVKIMYNLAILYGRTGQVDKAIQMLTDAIALKPDYRDLYWGLYVMYSETGKVNEAKTVAQLYLTKVDPGDTEFKKIVTEP